MEINIDIPCASCKFCDVKQFEATRKGYCSNCWSCGPRNGWTEFRFVRRRKANAETN